MGSSRVCTSIHHHAPCDSSHPLINLWVAHLRSSSSLSLSLFHPLPLSLPPSPSRFRSLSSARSLTRRDVSYRIVPCQPTPCSTIPLAVEATASLVRLGELEVSNHVLRLAYAMALIRFLNGFCDAEQVRDPRMTLPISRCVLGVQCCIIVSRMQ